MKRDQKELASLDDWLAEEGILEEVTEKAKAKIEIRPFKPERYIKDTESQLELLLDAWEANDPKYLQIAFEAVIKARENGDA